MSEHTHLNHSQLNADKYTGTIPFFSNLQVKTYKFGKPAGKITLTVDVQAGKLFAVKPTKDILNEQNVFTHNKSM